MDHVGELFFDLDSTLRERGSRVAASSRRTFGTVTGARENEKADRPPITPCHLFASSEPENISLGKIAAQRYD
jgi:hypothetical protein